MKFCMPMQTLDLVLVTAVMMRMDPRPAQMMTPEQTAMREWASHCGTASTDNSEEVNEELFMIWKLRKDMRIKQKQYDAVIRDILNLQLFKQLKYSFCENFSQERLIRTLSAFPHLISPLRLGCETCQNIYQREHLHLLFSVWNEIRDCIIPSSLLRYQRGSRKFTRLRHSLLLGQPKCGDPQKMYT